MWMLLRYEGMFMMCWTMRTVRTGAMLVAGITLFFGMNVYAGEETANDFFAIYNEAQIDDYNELQSEYVSAKAAYVEAVTDIQRTEFYNAAAQTAEEYFEREEARIDREISAVMESNNAVRKEIADGIFGEWDELVICDAKYKVNVSRIEELLKEKDKYVALGARSIDYDSAEELRQEADKLRDSYQAASAVSILGSVTDVKYPLGKETVVTSKWGSRIDPITSSGINFHSGLDLRAAVGTEVLALFNGKVESAGYNAVAGYYVRIDHGNGIKTYYCHLSEIKCSEGQDVKQYDCIALSGNTGSRTTGPHLHLAVYIDNNSVDPGILFNS